MLERLEVERAGPAPRLELDFSQRVNFLTRDNCLGKTFLLDIAWWALTRATQMPGTSPAREIVFLIEEVEAHLHPQWQRCIVPASLDVTEALAGLTLSWHKGSSKT